MNVVVCRFYGTIKSTGFPQNATTTVSRIHTQIYKRLWDRRLSSQISEIMAFYISRKIDCVSCFCCFVCISLLLFAAKKGINDVIVNSMDESNSAIWRNTQYYMPEIDWFIFIKRVDCYIFYLPIYALRTLLHCSFKKKLYADLR